VTSISSLLRGAAGVIAAAALAIGAGAAAQAASNSILSVSPPAGYPQLNFPNATGHPAHIMPTPAMARQMQSARTLSAPPPSSLTYHGGPIMTPNVTIYTIYWKPAGKVMASNYKSVLNGMLSHYAGHAIANINTQYYQTVSSVTTYSSGLGSLGGTYTDTSAYPASGCTTYTVSGITPIGCLTDAQIQAEVTKVMAISAPGKPVWTAGKNKIFLVFTAKGMESCIDNTEASCAYIGVNGYCAYHGYFGTSASPTIYGNEPYGEPSHCNTVAAANLPNGGGGYADTAATAARHEVSEASTDPLLTAWWDSTTGAENSDKCAYTYGVNSWAFNGSIYLANYMWAGKFYELQQEWSQHASAGAGACVQQGP
jgi:hypothetical protein